MLLRKLLLLFMEAPYLLALKCLSGHPTAPTICSTQSYCVTVRTSRGSVQRSCDGNGLSHFSLCALNPALRRSGTLPSDYAVYAGTSNSRRYAASGTSSALSASQHHTCFNGGDLGEICCCQYEYCNAAAGCSAGLLALAAALLLVVLLS